jgi:2'-5' RNA ligase
MNTRTQLSLYVPQPLGARLEAVRRRLDPIQANLIPAHVTLCREDELGSLDLTALHSHFGASEARPFTLRFGSPESFQGHGVLLPCIEGEAEFQALRQWLLGSRNLRRHAPHITLAHPRNPQAQSNTLENAAELAGGITVTFSTVLQIRQQGSAAWQVVAEYALAGARQ